MHSTTPHAKGCKGKKNKVMPVITTKPHTSLPITWPNYKTAGSPVLPSQTQVTEFRPSPGARHPMGKVRDKAPFSNQYYLSCLVRKRGAISLSQSPDPDNNRDFFKTLTVIPPWNNNKLYKPFTVILQVLHNNRDLTSHSYLHHVESCSPWAKGLTYPSTMGNNMDIMPTCPGSGG